MSNPTLFDDDFERSAAVNSGESETSTQAVQTALSAVVPTATPERRRRLRICVLGSGSGGNSAVVQYGRDAMLIDAGFGPTTTARRLQQAGLSLADVRGICLTHLDQDHFRPTWTATMLGWKMPVWVHRWHLEAMRMHPVGVELVAAGLVRTFHEDAFEIVRDLVVTTVALAHDTKGTFAFHVRSPEGARIGYATDLGHVPARLVETFAGVDLLAIESNYDPPMQLKSNRPLFLKRRVMGQAGHLSNEQAFEMVCNVEKASGPGRPEQIVLLHRSQQCNHPDRVREIFSQSPGVFARVTLTEQRRRSKWFEVKTEKVREERQLSLGF